MHAMFFLFFLLNSEKEQAEKIASAHDTQSIRSVFSNHGCETRYNDQMTNKRAREAK